MTRGCKNSLSVFRLAGIALCVLGLILLIVFVPYKVWLSVLGIGLISAGLLFLRFGDR